MPDLLINTIISLSKTFVSFGGDKILQMVISYWLNVFCFFYKRSVEYIQPIFMYNSIFHKINDFVLLSSLLVYLSANGGDFNTTEAPYQLNTCLNV